PLVGGAAPAGGVLADVPHAGDQLRLARAPAEVLPAQQADGGHGRRRALADVAVAVVTAAGGARLARVQPAHGAVEGRRGDLQAGHLAALEGHQLPADDGGVAAAARLVAPAAGDRVLGRHDEVDGLLGRPLERLVAGQPVRLAQGDGRQAVRVHAAVEVAVLLLVVDEEL